jgi:heme/copper-type cytochrome/quinol oxidase subunit 1
MPSTTGAAMPTSSGFLGAVAAWLTTTDHRRIGRLFMGFSVLWVLSIVVVNAILGFERIDSASIAINEGALPQLFAASRTLASFGVLIPLTLGLAIAVVPTQVGARSIMFARNATFGFYLWLFGTVVVVGSLIANGGPGGGSATMVDLYLLGLATTMLGLIVASISVIATVITARTAGTDLADIPVFSWAALIGAVSTVMTLPVALGTLIYVAVDHQYVKVAFGGNTEISTWLGWAMTQPQTFLYVIPVVGVLAELAPAVARKAQPLRGGVFVGIGLMSVALFGSVSQNIHDFEWSGTVSDKVQSFVPYAMFNLLPLLGMVVVLGLALLALRSDTLKITPAFIPVFLGGGMILTALLGNAVQLLSSAQLAGTVFEEGVLHYTTYGAVLVLWGAVAHWSTQLWGRELPAQAVIGLGVLGFAGTVLAALPMYIAGFADQQAEVVADFTYGGPTGLWNSASTIGHALMALCVVAGVATATRSITASASTGVAQ